MYKDTKCTSTSTAEVTRMMHGITGCSRTFVTQLPISSHCTPHFHAPLCLSSFSKIAKIQRSRISSSAKGKTQSASGTCISDSHLIVAPPVCSKEGMKGLYLSGPIAVSLSNMGTIFVLVSSLFCFDRNINNFFIMVSIAITHKMSTVGHGAREWPRRRQGLIDQ
jgi:hypothetical protein